MANYLASLMMKALTNICNVSLDTSVHGTLIHAEDVIPGLNIDGADIPKEIYRFKRINKKSSSISTRLDWRFLSEGFELTLRQKGDDDEKILELIAHKIAAIQAKIDIALTQLPYEKTMICWLPKINAEGWGDYDSYNGGWGAFIDPRTRNKFCIHIHTATTDFPPNVKQAEIRAIFQISINFAVIYIAPPLKTTPI